MLQLLPSGTNLDLLSKFQQVKAISPQDGLIIDAHHIMEHTPSPVHRTRRCGVWCGGAESSAHNGSWATSQGARLAARHSHHLQPDFSSFTFPRTIAIQRSLRLVPYARIFSIDNRSISIEPRHYTVPPDAPTDWSCHHEQHQEPVTVTHAQTPTRDAPQTTSDAAVDSSATTPAQAYPSTSMSCSVAMAATEKINEPHGRHPFFVAVPDQ